MTRGLSFRVKLGERAGQPGGRLTRPAGGPGPTGPQPAVRGPGATPLPPAVWDRDPRRGNLKLALLVAVPRPAMSP